MTAEELRKKHPVFTYESFSYRFAGNNFVMSFVFRVKPDIQFTPRVVIKNAGKGRVETIPLEILDNLVFHIGLAEIPSYWKAALSPTIEIAAGVLAKPQIVFWQDLLWNGLSEFCYQNKIGIPKSAFVKIASLGERKFEAERLPVKERVLVPLGGGKDSIVTLEMLKGEREDLGIFVLNPQRFHKKVIKISGITRAIFAEREIHKKLLALNRAGYLNGHTPFSAYLAFISTLIAVFFGYSRIAVSNEKSADEPNLVWNGRKINHQYSKSSDFEKKFQAYAASYLVKNIEYKSFLRKFYEIDIAKMFAEYPQYFGAFLSCNRGLKEGRWCGKCPKCLFAYLILYPYLDIRARKKIFKKDLFRDHALIPLAKSFLGVGGPKPFECVGTKAEVKKAFRLATKKALKEKSALPPVLAYVRKYIAV